ncbi:MAG: CHRD domain-containing protein [Nitrososphaeraceae archaeon]
MISTKRAHSFLFMMVGISLIVGMISASVFINTSSNSAFAQSTGGKKFAATLSGKDEVPPKNTKATGAAEFTLSSDGKTMTYKVNVKDIDKVTMAHIHQGKAGVNGPVVAVLFKSNSPTGPENGALSQGNITSDKLEGPLKGKQVSDLVKLVEDGNTYSNVHTQQNPKGEIRGQIK